MEITAFDTPGGGFNPEFFAGKQLYIPTVATLSRSFTPLVQSFRTAECEEDNGGKEDDKGGACAVCRRKIGVDLEAVGDHV